MDRLEVGQTLYKVDHDIDSRGLHHWMIRRIPYSPELLPEINKTVFKSMDDINRLIEETDKQRVRCR